MEFFEPKFGVKQGDPMSPYLFLLAMSKLSRIISNKFEEGTWKSIRASRNGLWLSLLMFVDDLFLFEQATKDSTIMVVKTLQDFCNMLGYQVNHAKSSTFFFSYNADMGCRRRLVERSSFNEATFFCKYCGVAILERTLRIHDFQY